MWILLLIVVNLLPFYFFNIFYWLCYYSCPISPPYSPLPGTLPPTRILPFSSCPWVVHISSLASPFPILFLTSPCLFCTYNLCFFLFKRIYVFIFRERGREGEREGEQETSMCGCLSLGPHWEPGPQPRHVPWLGIEPTTTLFRRPALNPVSYTSQGYLYFLFPVPFPPSSPCSPTT